MDHSPIGVTRAVCMGSPPKLILFNQRITYPVILFIPIGLFNQDQSAFGKQHHVDIYPVSGSFVLSLGMHSRCSFMEKYASGQVFNHEKVRHVPFLIRNVVIFVQSREGRRDESQIRKTQACHDI